MTTQANQPADPRLVSSAMASFLQIGVVLIVLVWCYEILSPFIQIIGLFVGAVVLAVGYQILMIWLAAEDVEAETEASPRTQPPMSKPPAT